jgi:hypothetical protein
MMVNLQTGFELVYVIYDYWDQPRSGVADYHGEPHWFENIFDEEHDTYSEDYWLTRLTPAESARAKELSEIFLRWRQAFDRGEVDLSSHPALPQDTEHYAELKEGIQNAIKSKAAERFKVSGKFALLNLSMPKREMATFQVQWRG